MSALAHSVFGGCHAESAGPNRESIRPHPLGPAPRSCWCQRSHCLPRRPLAWQSATRGVRPQKPPRNGYRPWNEEMEVGHKMSQTVREAKLLQYLNEAYGKERELQTALEAHIAMTSRKPYLKRLRKHLTETKGHGRQVERRIKR